MSNIISQFQYFCNLILENFKIIVAILLITIFVFFWQINLIYEKVQNTEIEFKEIEGQFVNNLNTLNNQAYIVASKRGKKYHFLWCKSANSIKEKNRIYFKSEEEAKRRGLTLASSCK